MGKEAGAECRLDKGEDVDAGVDGSVVHPPALGRLPGKLQVPTEQGKSYIFYIAFVPQNFSSHLLDM